MRIEEKTMNKILRIFFIFFASISFTVINHPQTNKINNFIVFSANPERTLCVAYGNGNFKNLPKLNSPSSDLVEIRRVFNQLNCKNPQIQENSTIKKMRNSLESIESQADEKYVFLYISSHGVQINGKLYFFGTDSKLEEKDLINEKVVAEQAISLDEILSALTTSAIKVIVLDTCRIDKEIPIGYKPSIVSPQSFDNSIIVFATSPGAEAKGNNKGGLSVFTKAFVSHIFSRLPIRTILDRVNADVKNLSGNLQIPISESNYAGLFYFTEPETVYPIFKGNPPFNYRTEVIETAILNFQGDEKKIETNRVISFVEKLPNGVELEMIVLKRGCFQMGATDDQVEYIQKNLKKIQKNKFTQLDKEIQTERPNHQVCLENDFAISKYEITMAQYDGLMKLSNKRENGSLPMTDVSYFDIQEFLKKLSEYTQRKFRLPTESEWEFSIRGNKNNEWFAWGDNLVNKSNYNINFPFTLNIRKKDKLLYQQLKPISVFETPINSFGVGGLAGNVREIVEDSYAENYFSTPNDGSASMKNDLNFRVVRGGSFLTGAFSCRNSSRGFVGVKTKKNDLGFRIVTSDFELKDN